MKKFISILAITLLLFSIASTSAFAEISPQGDKTYKVTIDLGVREEEPSYEYVTDGETITLTSNTQSKDKTFKFVRWTITGEYEIVSGSLTSETLVIRPLGDVSIVQVLEDYYDDELEDEDKDDKEDKEDKKPSKKPQGDKNDSETSPPTNDNVLFILGSMFFVSLLATVVFGKRAK